MDYYNNDRKQEFLEYFVSNYKTSVHNLELVFSASREIEIASKQDVAIFKEIKSRNPLGL